MAPEYQRLYRSREDRLIAGVCGGLGDYFHLDPTLLRLLFVVGFFATGSGLLWGYLIMMIIVPEEVPASRDVVAGDAEEVSEE